MGRKSGQSKSTALFQIRLKNLDNDVLIIKGNEHEAASVLLAGTIVLSLNEPMTVKGVALRMYATVNLEWKDENAVAKGSNPRPTKFVKKIYEKYFDSSEFKQRIKVIQQNASNSALSNGATSPGTGSRPLMKHNSSSASLKSFGALRSKSSSSLAHTFSSSNLNHSSSNLSNLSHSNTLPAGNHEFPFSAILPGNIPESVEGLPGGSVVYRLEASLERGKFQNSLHTKKHLRVIRTMTTDAVELSETVAVDNTWPKKVEYSLNVPQKAIAIGSTIPVSFMLVPLLKGLRLGDVKIELVELYSFAGYLPPAFHGERLIQSKLIPKPSEEDPAFQMDRWEITTHIKVPDTLSQCTQDCDISQHMKVRHKLKFCIGLINPDNHVSELRASLPIQLFISPFVTIRATYDDESETNSLSDHEDRRSINGGSGAGSTTQNEEILFGSAMSSSTSLNNYNNVNGEGIPLSASSSTTSFNGLVAPPVYEKHVLDRLWSDVSPIESPMGSGSQTPHSDNEMQHFSMSPMDCQRLTENLKQLSIQRNSDDNDTSSINTNSNNNTSSSANRAVFNLDGDYFPKQSDNTSPMLATPGGTLSPPTHLSRTNSSTQLSTSTKVPTYMEALRSDSNDGNLSPAYEPPLPGSHINLAELDRRLEEHSTKTKNLRPGLGGSSRNSHSGGSSPLTSRNHSHSNLTAALGLSRSHSSKAHSNSNSSVNLHPLQPAHLHNQDHAVTQLSSSASERNRLANSLSNTPVRSTSSISLNNLSFLNKKHK